MTPEQKASQQLADMISAHEATGRALERETKQFTRALAAQMPINTREMLNKRAAGLLGDVLEFHGDVQAWDARVTAQDGGGKRVDANATIA